MRSSKWFEDDEQLVDALREAVAEAMAVPQVMVEAAKATYAWRTVDQELERLTLSFDSLVAGGELIRAVAHEGVRKLTFEGDGLGLEIEIGIEKILGQIFPMHSGLITMTAESDDVLETWADELGCFIFDRPSTGMIRVRCDTHNGKFVTEWISL